MMKKEKNVSISAVDNNGALSKPSAYSAGSAEITKKSVVRKLKYGGTATALISVFIAAVVLVNVLLSYADTRFRLKWDMTAEKTFSLDEETMTFLGELNKKQLKNGPVEIIVLGDESVYRANSSQVDTVPVYKYIVETLDNYTKNSDKIAVKFIDPRYNPQFFNSRGISLDDGTDTASDVFMIVYSPDTGRYRTVKSTIFDDMQYVGLERRITSGLLYVTLDNISKIGFATGHGEAKTAYFYELLKENGFDVYAIDFSDKTMQRIPDDISMLIICQPKRGYSTDDIALIDAWLSNSEQYGHHLAVFTDLDAYSDRHLEGYFNEWGIELGTENVFDTVASGNVYTSGSYCPILRVYYDDEAADIIGTNTALGSWQNFQLGKVRSVSKLYDRKDNISTMALIKTSDTAFGHYTASTSSISLTNFKDYCTKKAEDTDGPFNLGVIAVKSRYEGTEQFSSTVTVIGSMSPVEDYFVSNVDGANQQTAQFLIKLVRSAVSTTQATDSMILPDTLVFNALNFENDLQFYGVLIGIVIVIPAILLVCGIVVAIRRKRL